MRISDWSSDVCSSDLPGPGRVSAQRPNQFGAGTNLQLAIDRVQLEFDGASRPRQVLGNLVVAQTLGHQLRHAALGRRQAQIGSASCRERVCQYVWLSGVADALKQKTNYQTTTY